MKTKLFFILLFICSQFISSQILTWTPRFATANDTISIIYDAAQGNGALVNVFPVYAHTGVITNLSTTPSDWRYVKTQWNQNTAANTMLYLGDNKWKISFHIRSYYGVPVSEQVLSLAFVFRNANGSIVGRDVDGSDIFLPIYQDGLNVAITSPTQTPYFAQLNDTVHIEAQSINSTNLELYIDNNLITQTTGTILNHSIVANDYGRTNIMAIARNNVGEVKADSFYFVVNPPVITQALPQGIIDGINYISTTSVVLSLYAPYKDFVYVIGDFNNWEINPNYLMKRTPDNNRYWIEINGLTPQEEYIFQYYVDGYLRIADPYSEKISDPWHDSFISNATYPGLKPYPIGKTTQIAGYLQTAQQPYEWQTTDFVRPANEDLVIYELLIRDFTSQHSYQSVIDTLGYLKRLGVNAIELMPVMEFEGNNSWGYNPSFYFAPDKYYGPKNNLKKLIDACHENGIAVIFDIVLNHSYGQCPLVRLYAENMSLNPWFNEVSPNPVFSWGYDFNHESQATKDFVDRVVTYWITEYNIDGYRFDFTKGLTNTPGDGWAYDQARINILKRIADVIWNVDTTFYVILEHFSENSEEKVLADYGMMIWGNLNHSYSEASMGYHDNNKSNLTGTSYKARGYLYPHLIPYMESHDEERLIYKNLQYGNSSGDYNIKNLNTALNRVKLAAAFYFTIPGPKMIWQFGELGYDYSIDYDCRVCPKPIRWDYYQDERRNNLYKTFSALINLKLENEAFRSTNFSMDVAGSSKRITIYHPTMDVVVLGNFDVVPQSINPNFTRTGTWYDYFWNDSISVAGLFDPIMLEPGEFFVYTTKKLPPPEQGILLNTEDEEWNAQVESYALFQNYPNPFNPSTTIQYNIPEHSFVTLKIYDILGKEIKTLVSQEKKSGHYTIRWNGNDNTGNKVAGGVYFYRLNAGDFLVTKKMILLY